MANIGVRIGANIYTLMKNAGISRKELAENINFSYRDLCKILEGRLMVSPVELEKIADYFGKTKDELISFESERVVPELQYMKEFSDTKNLDKILQLMDNYVELKETV